MVALTDAKREACRAEFTQALSNIFEPLGLVKTEARAAVDATDQWISDNKAAFNTALPEPAKSAMTASQKAQMFSVVALKRFAEGL